MNVRYGLQATATFEIQGAVRYGLQATAGFAVIDGFPPVIESIYCLDQYNNPLNSLDDTLKIGSTNIYDDPRGWTGLDTIEYRYGLNDPLCPNNYIDVAPSEGVNFHPFSPVILVAGAIVYFQLIVTDDFENIFTTELDSVVIEGVPIRYGIQANGSFSIIEEIVLGIGNEVVMMSPSEFPKRKMKVF